MLDRRAVWTTVLVVFLGLALPAVAQETEEADGAEVEATDDVEEDVDRVGDLFQREPVVYQITFPRMWAIITPAFGLDGFFDMHPNQWSDGQTNWSFGAEFIIRRLEEFDLVFSLDYADLSTPDDWWLEADEEIIDTDWGENHLALVTVDVAINWLTQLESYWDLYYGLGLGIGIVTGQFLKQDVDPSCIEDAGVNPFQSTEGQVVRANCFTEGGEPILSPSQGIQEEDRVPPVIPALTFTFGSRWIIDGDWAIQLELGFKNIYFYSGLEFGYIFE